jgi:hypothetical protein
MEDHKEYYRKRFEAERQEELAKNSILIDDFAKFGLSKGIKLTVDNFDYSPTIGIIAKFPNIVGLLNHNIQWDKENLVSVSKLENELTKQPYMSGYYYADKYMVMAHPYFRRSYYENNNFAPSFIDIFWRFQRPGQEKFISIDKDRVRINVDNRMYMEQDTWFGAKFQSSISDIEDGIVKLRPPLALDSFEIEFFFGNTYSLDIKWSSKDGIKSFQAEEFKAETTKIIKQGKEYHPVKYLHAEFDTAAESFRHFDGAIHFYTDEEYYQRRDNDFNYNNKSDRKLKTLSQKLFKINGQLETKDWIELSSHFLTGDPLVFEYFEGKLPDRITEIVNKIMASREGNHSA